MGWLPNGRVFKSLRTWLLAFGVLSISVVYVAAQEAPPPEINAKPSKDARWKAVPNNKGVFVDMTSIRHFDVPDDPRTHCTAAMHPDECQLPWPDTTVDIKSGGAVLKGDGYWCKRPDITVGNGGFGAVGGKEHPVPREAIRKMVCGKN